MDRDEAVRGVAAALAVIAVAVAFVAATGGIDTGGLLGGGDDPGTVAELDDEDLPDGVDREAGLTDATALSTAHNDSLAGSAYAMNLTVDQTVDGGGTVRVVQTTRTDGAGTFATSFVREGNGEIERTVWGNESVAVSRLVVNGGERFGELDPAGPRRNLSGHVVLSELLSAGDFAVVEVTTRGGETAVVLSADTLSGDAGDLFGGIDTISSYSGTAVVGESGTVYELDVGIAFTDAEGRSVTGTYSFSIEGIGETTVDRPEWVGDALGQSGAGIRPGLRTTPAFVR